MRTSILGLLLLLFLLEPRGAALPDDRAEERIYLDSHHGLHFTDSLTGIVYDIANGPELSVVPGPARFRFDIPNSEKQYTVHLRDYESLPEPPRPEVRGMYRPPMFGHQYLVAFLRLSDPKNETSCFTIAAAKRYIHMLSLSVRLHTGNQVGLDESDSFITPDCLPVNASCYAAGSGCLVNNMSQVASQRYGKDFNRNFVTRIFMSHSACDAPTGWIGLAAVSNNDAWVGGWNYWAIIRTWYSPPEDLGMSNYGTIVHEVHHTMGFLHASTGDVNAIGFIKDFTYVNGYDDWACFMGWGGGWWMIPDPYAWHNVVARDNYIAHWFRNTEDGEHIYRLLAWDHPLTRLFLGGGAPSFAEDEKVKNMEFRYHAAALYFPFAQNFSSTLPSTITSAKLSMFYRSVGHGQISYGSRGVMLALGRIIKDGRNVAGAGSNQVNAMNDGVGNWGAATLPLGYVSMPELDTGTLSFEVLRFHQLLNPNPNISLVENPPANITLDDIPYVEILIKQLPGVPFSKPTVQKTLDIELAPSFANCERNGTEILCERFTPRNVYWAYVKGGPGSCREGNRNIPRLYNKDLNLINRGRAAFNAYRGSKMSAPVQFKCGRKDTEIVQTALVREAQRPSFLKDVIDYSSCQVFVRAANETSESAFRPYPPDAPAGKRWDAVVVRSITPVENGEVYLSDLYGNRKPLELHGTGGMQLLEPYAMQAFTDSMVVIRNDTRVYGADFFYRYRTTPSQRLAVTRFDAKTKTFSLSAADMPSMFSVPTLLERTTFSANKWHFFVYTLAEMNDFIFFDFAGKLPNNLILYLETDNGIFTQRLWHMAGLDNISFRLSFYDVHLATGGWSEIYRFQFNKEVTLESIRVAATATINSDFPNKRPAGNFTETLGNFRFRFVCDGSQQKYESSSEFSATFMGETFHVQDVSESFTFTASKLVDPRDSVWVPNRGILVALAAVLLLL